MSEREPLLGRVASRNQNEDKPLVDFDPNGDSENPMDWPVAYKWGILCLLAFMAFTVTFTCIGVVPVANKIVFDLVGKESKSASVLLVTIWELGEAAGPLLIAPLSEIFGRYPVYNAANIIFIFGIMLSATSQSVNVLIFARFLTGFATASNVLNPAIIGDMFASEERGSGMSLVFLAPLLGGAIGPAIAGGIAETLGWRKILWMAALLAVICETVFFLLFRETYKVPILQRKAARLRKETQDESLRCAWDDDGSGAGLFWSSLRTSIARPITVLVDSFVLKILALYTGIFFTFYYVMATTLPEILQDIYGFSSAQTGSSFLSFSTGAIAGILVCNAFLDRIYVMLGKDRGESPRPEYRLPLMVAGAFVLPVVIAFYGWIPFARWPVSMLLLAVGLLGFVLMILGVPSSSYVVDAFGLYSASAMTIVLICRCLGGTLLPLAIPYLIDAFGLGYGFLLLASILTVLIPLPIAIMRYGSNWRKRSIYTRND